MTNARSTHLSARRAPPLLGAALGVVALLASACSSSTTTTSTTAAAPMTTTSSTAAGAPTTTASSASGVHNLPASAQVKADLTAAFVALKQVPASDVVGTAPGSVYYAYDPSTTTYWALASFDLSPGATQPVQVGWQDGGGQGLFKMVAGSSWSVQTGVIPPYCGEVKFFPPSVLAAWSITQPSGLTC
jgi:hypothetical protein